MKISRIGKFGEIRTTLFIRKVIKGEYQLFENLLIPTANSKNTTEIDKVLVSKKGIFCIESKFWGGYLNGTDVGDWTQTQYMYGFKRTKKLPNPVIQNEGHVNAIEKLFNGEYKTLNIVFLTGFTKNYVKSDFVFDIATFRNLYESLEEVLSDTDVKEICGKLSNYVASDDQLVKHAEEVNNRKGAKKEATYELLDD